MISLNLDNAMRSFLGILTCLLLQFTAYAQGNYTISGTVKNKKGDKLPSVTVFIAGSEKATITDEQGDFKLIGLQPGTYQVVVNVLGYVSIKQDVALNDGSEILDLILAEKNIALSEVVIKAKKISKEDLATFIKYFMGESYDPKNCKILNTEQLDLVKTDTALNASTADFLIIENYLLGYRIKYLLKNFFYNYKLKQTFYDGDHTFEPLTGTEKQQRTWAKNRKQAYEGSVMHFYRSVYAGTARKEGFLIYKGLNYGGLLADNDPTDAERFVTRTDSNFIIMKAKPWTYVLYNKKMAAKHNNEITRAVALVDILAEKSSILSIDAKMDSRGSLSGIGEVSYRGFWANKRVAEQLPFEYVPD
jgi:hypothetical protein